jgi:hypothetical protein
LGEGLRLRVSEPFQVRALGPVLWVGEEPLTGADNPSVGVYRFYAFSPEKLRVDAPIALLWNCPARAAQGGKVCYAVPRRE